MHFLKAAVLAAAGLATTALAQNAIITVETSHGGAATGLKNTTINVPLNMVYTSSSVLDQVSYLFLVGSQSIDVNHISCQAFMNTNGTLPRGNAFTYSHPSYLSTNTVVVGSIFCRPEVNTTSSTRITITPTRSTGSSATASQTALSTTSVSGSEASAGPATSVFLSTTVVSAMASTGLSPSTITYTSVPDGTSGYWTRQSTVTTGAEATGAAVETPSSTPRLASGGAAAGLPVEESAWFGLAIAALFFAMVV